MKFEGFVQISARFGTFICREAEDVEDYICIKGPVCITLQTETDPKTGQVQRIWNKDRVKLRYLQKPIVGVDVLDPADLDRSSKEIYAALTGVVI